MAHERRRQYTLFEWIIKNNLDPEHKLMKLAKCIEWNQVTDSLSKLQSQRTEGETDTYDGGFASLKAHEQFE